MKDMVIVDNSVYSFAYQIDNGIPIIPFYQDPQDEEMLHLIFYLNCLATCEDVRQQNRDAFELHKLHQNAIQPAAHNNSMTVSANSVAQENNIVYRQRSEDVKDFEVDEKIVGGPYGMTQNQIVQEQTNEDEY